MKSFQRINQRGVVMLLTITNKFFQFADWDIIQLYLNLTSFRQRSIKIFPFLDDRNCIITDYFFRLIWRYLSNVILFYNKNVIATICDIQITIKSIITLDIPNPSKFIVKEKVFIVTQS